MPVPVGVAGEGERREAQRFDDDPQLLPEFADQALFRRLIRLDLSPGKFPQAGHGPSRRALRQEDAAVGIDQRDGDDQLKAQISGRSSGPA